MRIIILVAIFAYFENRVRSQDELKFVEDQRTCNGRLSYEIMPADDFFKSYQNTTGSSVSDCVDRCYRKFQFCHAVRFDDLQKTCFYSYKSPMRCNGKDQESTASTSATVSCITCVGESQKIELAKKVIVVEAKKTTSSTTTTVNFQTSDTETSETSTSATSSTTVRSTTTVTTMSEAPSTVATTSKSETSSATTVAPTKTVQTSKFEEFTTETTKQREIATKFVPRVISTTISTTELTTQNTVDESNTNVLAENRIDNSIDENVLKKKSAKFVKNLQPLSTSRAQQVSSRFGTKCNTALQSPCSKGVGRDCSLVEGTTCQICKCPLKSAARGCLGPYGLNETYRLALLTNAEKCPNGRRAQKVFRFQRVENPMSDDLCDAVMQPYCGYQLDKGSWRMPRSVDECHFFCFTDQELTDNNIDVKNLQKLFAQ